VYNLWPGSPCVPWQAFSLTHATDSSPFSVGCFHVAHQNCVRFREVASPEAARNGATSAQGGLMRFPAETDLMPNPVIGHADAGLNQAARPVATRPSRRGASHGTIRRRNPQAQTDKTCDGEGGVYRPGPPAVQPIQKATSSIATCMAFESAAHRRQTRQDRFGNQLKRQARSNRFPPPATNGLPIRSKAIAQSPFGNALDPFSIAASSEIVRTGRFAHHIGAYKSTPA